MIIKTNKIYNDNCLNVLNKIPDNYVNLIITSPPYADSRKNTYGGIHPDKYVEWFMPIANQLYRVIAEDGSFVLNIKERAFNGERHTYVIELILEMRKSGWFWIEEYCWHKKNCYPGKWKNRFRDAWERCLHFTKNKEFRMHQDAVKVPVGDWAGKRLTNLSVTDKIRDLSKTNSGFGKKIENWIGREMVYPTNVLHLATECAYKNHSAVFPLSLPTWFIKLFTKEGDIVLDPFLGSGTTAIAAKNLNRQYIGIEIMKEYCDLAERSLNGINESLFAASK